MKDVEVGPGMERVVYGVYSKRVLCGWFCESSRIRKSTSYACGMDGERLLQGRLWVPERRG